jgi:hypothetical protein
VNWYTYRFSSDYFNSCNKTSLGVPKNQLGIQNAATGIAYTGLIALSPNTGNYSELIGCQLKEKLIVGKKYFVCFKASLSETSNFGCNNLGVLFLTEPSTNSSAFSLTNRATIYSSSIITDCTNWTVISGSFIADSAYEYITLGNLFEENLTNIEKSYPPPDFGEDRSYYYIDDVCVSSDSTCYQKVNVSVPRKEKRITIYPNPFEDILTFKSVENSAKEVIIFDSVSKEIDRQSFSDILCVNLLHSNPGIYYYEISDKSGLIERGRLVKD